MIHSRLAAVVIVAAFAPVAALASAPQLIGPEPILVNGSSGTQTDPHVSDGVVSYTSIVSSSSEIRHQDLTVGGSTDVAVPKAAGEQDSLSDVSGDIIVFRRLDGTSTRRIMFYDRAAGGAPVELAPKAGARRGFAAIGGDTVAFQEFDPTTNSISNICVARISDPSAPAVCLTGDGKLNREASVSPDGSTVVFSKCSSTGTSCDVYVVSRDPATGSWESPRQLTTSAGEDVLPDTNGEIVVYASNAGGSWDIKYVNVDGTNERTLVLSDDAGANEHNPNIAGDLIAFERTLSGESNADIYILDVASNALWILDETPEVDETLNDISVTGDASTGLTAWVVWAANHGTTSGTDVWAANFTFGGAPPCESEPAQDPAEVCADPGSRALLATVEVNRTTGDPNSAAASFVASSGEEGVLCIDNRRATAGWVELNGTLEVGPSAFKHKTTGIARAVTLATSNTLRGTIAGQKGTSYEARIYGAAPQCEELSAIDRVNAVLAAAERITVAGNTRESLRAIEGVRLTVLSNGMVVAEEDQLVPRSNAMGCGASGAGSLGAAALLLLAALRRRR